MIEYRFRTKDGRWIWCLSRNRVFSRCPDGSVSQIIGTVMDITDRKLVERKLRKSEERYRRLTGLLPAAMYMIDSEGSITYYNEQAARIWGRSPRLGDTEERFCGSFRLYRPDGSLLPHDQTPMAVALRTGVSFRAQEVTIERPEGMILKISVNIDAIRDADGRICGAINVFTDITEHKKTEEALRKSEELFRTVVENSWDGIHQVDLSTGRFVFTSPSLGRLTGFTSEELMLPMKDVADRLHPADREAVRRYLKRIIAGGKTREASGIPMASEKAGNTGGLATVGRRFSTRTARRSLSWVSAGTSRIQSSFSLLWNTPRSSWKRKWLGGPRWPRHGQGSCKSWPWN